MGHEEGEMKELERENHDLPRSGGYKPNGGFTWRVNSNKNYNSEPGSEQHSAATVLRVGSMAALVLAAGFAALWVPPTTSTPALLAWAALVLESEDPSSLI